MTDPTNPAAATLGDVNDLFAAERLGDHRAAEDRQAHLDQRIAAGTLIPLGGDRYRINDPTSLDHGEIWTIRNGALQPQHGLDMSTGQAALYTAVPAWHQVGTVIPGGTTDIDQVLTAARIDYTVHRRPVLYQATFAGPTQVLADQFVTVRDDTGAGLGVVGARYEVLQNRDIFQFLQDLVDSTDVTWESAGALRGGRRVFVSIRLPDTVTIDAAGINDQIIPYIVAVNSHDGSSQAQVVVTPWRPVCGNTERFALRDAHTRWGVSHTRNARDRVAEARRTLGLSLAYYQQYTAEEETLACTDLAIAEFHQLIDELWPTPAADASARAVRNHTDRRDTLHQLHAANTERLGRTAYAAERTITEYLDWNTRIRPGAALRGDHLAARATAVLEGTNDPLKARAHRRLLTLTRR